jgi:hypothetical protein
MSFLSPRVALLAVCLSVLPLTASHAQASIEELEADEVLPLSGLNTETEPLSVLSFHVNTSTNPRICTEAVRLAVLNYLPPGPNSEAGYKLRVLRPNHGEFITDFSLDLNDDPDMSWEALSSFPSSGSACNFSGLLVRGGIEYSSSHGKVIAYVDGRFQVVFKIGYDMDLVDLDFDGIPEILSADFPTGDGGSSSWFQIWTWNGGKYVKVAHVHLSKIFTPEVVKAVKQVKANRHEPGSTAKPENK